jgi:predicted RNA binding protein with dsRBD fold (UPF0201 family)
MFLLKIEAEVRPTEDVDKVLRAVSNFFTLETYSMIEAIPYPRLIAESRDIKSLLKLHEMLRQDRVLDAARKVLESGIIDDRILRFKLHKQSAYAGHISFVHSDEESPLGPIKVTVESDVLKEIVDWLAPKTSNGRPLWEKPIPKA